MKRVICVLILAAVVFAPVIGLSEDEETVLMARVIYAMAKDEPDEVAYGIGTVIMNRVDSPWFPGDVVSVIKQQHQFAYGSQYDSRALSIAREVVAGQRNLSKDIYYLRALDATEGWNIEAAQAVMGNYGFYADSQA